jgi:hypothetical protein
MMATKSSATPATIQYQIRHFDENGAISLTEIMFQAVRSDGSRARFVVDRSGAPPIRSVYDFSKGIDVAVDPLIKAVIRLPLTGPARIPATCESMWGPEECRGSVPDKALGFSLEKVVRVEHGDTSEFLVAADLDYRPLKRTITSNGVAVQDWTAIEVRQGEPDPALFEIPGEYETVTRDVFYERGMEARSLTPNPKLVERFRHLEQGSAVGVGCCR